jgi:polyhydroxyalkanoate synthesis regulator phasin
MTADTPARVSDELLGLIVPRIERAEAADRYDDSAENIASSLALDLRDSRALTQAQAERIAALEEEVARWRTQSDDWQKRGWELGTQLDAAESSLAETRAKVEGLEKALRDLVAYGCPHCPDDRCFGEPRENCPLAAPLAALAALPEAKPAAQAEGLP